MLLKILLQNIGLVWFLFLLLVIRILVQVVFFGQGSFFFDYKSFFQYDCEECIEGVIECCYDCYDVVWECGVVFENYQGREGEYDFSSE